MHKKNDFRREIYISGPQCIVVMRLEMETVQGESEPIPPELFAKQAMFWAPVTPEEKFNPHVARIIPPKKHSQTKSENVLRWETKFSRVKTFLCSNHKCAHTHTVAIREIEPRACYIIICAVATLCFKALKWELFATELEVCYSRCFLAMNKIDLRLAGIAGLSEIIVFWFLC